MSFKQNLLIGLCLVACLSLGSAERARYDNYRLYKVIADTEKELAVLKDLEGASDSLMFLDGIHLVGKDVHVVVAPHKLPDFLQIIGTNEIEYVLVEVNFQILLEDDEVQVSTRSSSYSWDAYHTLDDTYKWMQSLAEAYPSVVELIEGGKTYEGRSILGVKISSSKGSESKPGIFIEAGIHSREWIASATATYIINQLLTSKNAQIQSVAEKYDWYIIPHANPDGYVYTHTTDRMWRKTRRPYGSCFGADPNRNWGNHWNEVGSSNNPCSDTYAGPAEFSEIETKSLSNYIKSLKSKIQLYISFHAYSQYLLYPYGYTGQLPENAQDLKKVYNVALSAMNKRYGTKYTGGNIYDAIYPASGSSIDWAYDKENVKMAFCYELRPSDTSYGVGFKLPASQIQPTGEETLDSIVAMIGEVDRLGYFKQ